MDKYFAGFLIAAALGVAVELWQRRFLRGWGGLALTLVAQLGLSIGLLAALAQIGERRLGGDALAAAASTVMLMGFLLLVLIANGVLGALRVRRMRRAAADGEAAEAPPAA